MNRSPNTTASFLLFTAVLISCQKTGGGPDTRGEVKAIHVVEYKTNMPIENATFSIYKMGVTDTSCNCGTFNLLEEELTDKNGNCQVSKINFNMANIAMGVRAINYYEIIEMAEYPRKDRYEMDLTGEIKLHLIKINNYTDSVFMTITANGERAESTKSAFQFSPFPRDTSFTIPAFGEQLNNITWTILDNITTLPLAIGGPFKIDVSKNGIPELEIKY